MDFTIFCCHEFYSLFHFTWFYGGQQNVFVAPQLGFSLVKFLGGSLEFCWEWTPSCSKAFCVLFCSLLSGLFCVVLIIAQCTILEGVYFLDFQSYCFNLYLGDLFCTTYFLTFSSFFSVNMLFFHFVTILATYTFLRFLLKSVGKKL